MSGTASRPPLPVEAVSPPPFHLNHISKVKTGDPKLVAAPKSTYWLTPLNANPPKLGALLVPHAEALLAALPTLLLTMTVQSKLLPDTSGVVVNEAVPFVSTKMLL